MSTLLTSLQEALRVLHPPSDMVESLDLSRPGDSDTYTRLEELLGPTFAGQIAADAAWAREIVGSHQP